jgi:hypothetical protein
MKRFLLAAYLIMTTVLTADTIYLDGFKPFGPDVRGYAEATTANITGYDALLSNPAAFSVTPGQFTAFSVRQTGYLPLPELAELSQRVANGEFENFDPLAGGDAVDFLTNVVINNGTGSQTTFKTGFVGDGLGLGLIVDLDLFAKGNTLLGTEAIVNGGLAVIGGYSIPIELGPGTLHLGLSAGIIGRAYGQVDFLDALGVFGVGTGGTDLLNLPVDIGLGMSSNLGLIYELWDWKFGFSMEDLPLIPYAYYNQTLGELISNLGNPFLGTQVVDDTYVVPMKINTGVSWNPDLGKFSVMVDPTIAFDFKVPLYPLTYPYPSLFTMMHLGTEVRIIDIVRIRTGFNQGYFSGGIGVKLLFAELNLAFWSEETGRYAGEQRKSGLDIELALKF